MNEIWYGRALIYDSANSMQYGIKPLWMIFDKKDRYIKKYKWTKYIALFYSDQKCERIFDSTRILLSKEAIYHAFAIYHTLIYWWYNIWQLKLIWGMVHL